MDPVGQGLNFRGYLELVVQKDIMVRLPQQMLSNTPKIN